jgi:hypothetical protein
MGAYDIGISTAEEIGRLEVGRPEFRRSLMSLHAALRGHDAPYLFSLDRDNIVNPRTRRLTPKIHRSVAEAVQDLDRVIEMLPPEDRGFFSLRIGNGSPARSRDSCNTAEVTRQQETASMMFFRSYVEHGRFPRADQVRRVYPGADDDWLECFRLQARELRKYLGGRRGYLYCRDGSFTAFVKDAASRCGVGRYLSWCPADVWMVRSDREAEARAEVSAIVRRKKKDYARLQDLNRYLRDALLRKDVVGVSLKKVDLREGCALEEFNVADTARRHRIDRFEFHLSSDRKTSHLDFFLDGRKVMMCIRSFLPNFAFNVVRTEMRFHGAQAQLSKNTASFIDSVFSYFDEERPLMKDLPPAGALVESGAARRAGRIASSLSSAFGGSFHLGGGMSRVGDLTSWISGINTQEKAAGVTSESDLVRLKLQVLEYFNVFLKAEERGVLEDTVASFYYNAKREGEGFCPFVKIS